MREMKDSGIEWIGEIPEDWEIIKFKYLHSGSNVGVSIDKELWTTDQNDTIFYTAGLVPITTKYKNFPKEKYTSHSDLLLARNGTPYVYFPEPNAMYSDHIIRVKIRDNYCKKFIWYCLQKSISFEIVDTVSISTWSVSVWDKQILCIPLLAEQQKISAFLDRKCTEIDSVISKTKATIEEYKKLKQSVITQAVTKGIIPNRPMKDSGIEWIGEIPQEWEKIRIGRLFRLRNEKNYSSLDEVQLLSLYTGIGVFPHGEHEERGNKAVTAEGYNIVKKNDIVVNIILAWMGAIGISEYDGVTSPAYDVYIPDLSKVVPHYFHYVFRTQGIAGECYKYGRGIMMMRWRTYSPEFKAISVPYPPIKEQQEISNYLDEKCSEIDKLIAKKEQLLTEMENYKKAVIYEYVTGKKEIF